MLQLDKRRKVLSAVFLAATMLTVSACTGGSATPAPGTSAPTESSKTSAEVSAPNVSPSPNASESTTETAVPTLSESSNVTETPTEIPGSDEPSATESPEPLFSPESIKIISQETTNQASGKIEILKVQAPVNTRFEIGLGEPGVGTLVCKSKVLNDEEVLYQVDCQHQGAGQKLFAIITRGDFDYTFTKQLKR